MNMCSEMQNLRNCEYVSIEGGNLKALIELLRFSYNQEESQKRLQSLLWTCNMNPHGGSEESRYFTVEDSDAILAYICRMPVTLLIKGAVDRAFFVHETLVHPNYRKKGLGIKVNKSVLENTKGLCLGLWANEKLLPILLKVGWSVVGDLKPLRKILRLDNIISYRFRSKSLGYILRFLGKIYINVMKMAKQNRTSSEVTTYEITRFSENMKQPLDEMVKKFQLIAYRDPEYLNWRYIDIPYRKYMIYAVKKHGVFKGYVALRIEVDSKNIKKGIVVDLLCHPDENDCFVALFSKAEQYFSSSGADFIVCLSTNSIFRNWLRELGYKEAAAKVKEFFLIRNVENSSDKDVLEEFSNWYLTYGDSDYDMFIGELNARAK
jgi:hypothetical protein